MGYVIFQGFPTQPGVDSNNSVRIKSTSPVYTSPPGATGPYGDPINEYLNLNSSVVYTFYVESYTFSNGSPGSDISLYDPVYEWFIIRGTSSIYTTGGVAEIVETGTVTGATAMGVRRNLDPTYPISESYFEDTFNSVPYLVYSLTDWDPTTPKPGDSLSPANAGFSDPEQRFFRVSQTVPLGTPITISGAYLNNSPTYTSGNSYTKNSWEEDTIIEAYWDSSTSTYVYRLPNKPVVTNTSGTIPTNPSYVSDATLIPLYALGALSAGGILNASVDLIPYEIESLLLTKPQSAGTAVVTFTYSNFEDGDRLGVYLRGSERGDFRTLEDSDYFISKSQSGAIPGYKWNYVKMFGNPPIPLSPPSWSDTDSYEYPDSSGTFYRNRFDDSSFIRYYDGKDPNWEIETQDLATSGYTYVYLSPGVSHSTPTGLTPSWIYETSDINLDGSFGSCVVFIDNTTSYGITISGASAATYGDLINVLNEKIVDWSTPPVKYYTPTPISYQVGAYFTLENGQLKLTSASQSVDSWAKIIEPPPIGGGGLTYWLDAAQLANPTIQGSELFSSLNNFSSHNLSGIYGSAAQPSINNIKKSAVSNLLTMKVTLSVTPTITIQALPGNTVVIGGPIAFSVETESFQGPGPIYTWEISDDFGVTWTTYQAGPLPGFTITSITTIWNLRRVRAKLLSNYTGAPVVPNPVTSNEIIVFVVAQLPNGVWLTGTYNNINYNWLGTTASGTASSGIVSVNSVWPVARLPYVVNQMLSSFRYKTDKTYLYLTNTRYNSGLTTASYSIITEWNDSFIFSSQYPRVGLTSGCLAFYSNPNAVKDSRNLLMYRGNSNFIGPTYGIIDARVYELDFHIQGYSYFVQSYTSSSLQDSIGWAYFYTNNEFVWKMDNTDTLYPIGGNNGSKVSSSYYKTNNNINRFIDIEKFNLYFTYEKVSGGVNDGIDIYTSLNEPSKLAATFSLPSGSTKIASITQTSGASASDKFYLGLEGNRYLFFVGTSSSASTQIKLSNIIIEGYYHPENNRQYVTNISDISPIGIVAATYSANVGVGNTEDPGSQIYTLVFSKIGNSSFKAGIWENGFWNSGWRYDSNVYEFYGVSSFYDYNRGKNWKFVVNGPSASVSRFEVGDKISIGNVVSIDINEERRLIKSYFTITEIPDTKDSIVVELVSTFPLVRIQIDSIYHRIYITKNIWLYGVFLNGYFKGVWNSGLFKGYPRITEMYNSHWIDGTFDGGHFYGERISLDFIGTSRRQTVVGSQNVLRLSLTFGGIGFGQKHGLRVGDLITIEKDNNTQNSQYNRECTILNVVDEYTVITDIEYGVNIVTPETGTVYTNISTGLIQNFNFNSGNISKITSIDSMNSDSVFSYNSWIDVTYNSTSAVNIGRPQTVLDTLSNKQKTENNLFGWPTNDVLSSSSKFRDSFSTTTREYKLGTKYKIYNDFVGDSSKFEDFFGPTGPSSTLFLDQGWTYSIYDGSSLTFSRTVDTGVSPFIGEELKINVKGPGGVLNLQPTLNNVTDRLNYDIEKSRYSMVEFNLLDKKLGTQSYDFRSPMIHFNNVNEVSRISSTGSVVVEAATFLPIYENIEHVNTPSTKKYEYFFNKRNLSMYFRGNTMINSLPYISQEHQYIIDDLKFYEIDMIPFFKYFLENNINITLQVPYTGVSPVIDYDNYNFSYIDNISIGTDKNISIGTDNNIS